MARGKIMIIDDEPALVEMVKARLEAADYSVVSASNGEEGLVRIRDEKPDLVLLDILMPKKDGYSFVREQKRDDSIKHIPVIVLTAKPEMRELFAIEGVTDYIVKPFDDGALLNMIEKHLGGK